jgi:hypothetical protein
MSRLFVTRVAYAPTCNAIDIGDAVLDAMVKCGQSLREKSADHDVRCDSHTVVVTGVGAVASVIMSGELP